MSSAEPCRDSRVQITDSTVSCQSTLEPNPRPNSELHALLNECVLYRQLIISCRWMSVTFWGPIDDVALQRVYKCQ